MGLDMYLTARRSGIESVEEEEQDVGYWRKANAIHAWFVDNVQDSQDNCGDYDVTREQLTELLDTVNTVLSDLSKAKALLPTRQGFFFGFYDYDDWYIENLNDTVKIIEKALTLVEEGWTISYYSSW